MRQFGFNLQHIGNAGAGGLYGNDAIAGRGSFYAAFLEVFGTPSFQNQTEIAQDAARAQDYITRSIDRNAYRDRLGQDLSGSMLNYLQLGAMHGFWTALISHKAEAVVNAHSARVTE